MSEPGGVVPSPEASATTPASATTRGVRVGDVLLGKYRVERELGRGGMGYVVAARHLELGELVAIKMILGEYAASDEMVRRFMREARAAAQIASEHVVRVNDVGRLPSGEPYMVMELLKGEDLEAVLTRGPLDVPAAVDLLLQVIEAVAEAHAVGIVHRDLKPANLFLTRRRSGAPCVKVLDFGISKLIGDDTSRTHTATAGVLGSPLYMSPEQLRTPAEVDGRGDVWSLAVILFQMLTQDYPFVAETLPQLLVMVLETEPVRLRARLPLAPEGLEQVLVRALEKDRELRYPTVTDFALALAPYGTEASRVSLSSIESALPAREGASSPTLPAPASAPNASVTEETQAASRTIPMWPDRASTLEPVDTSLGGSSPGASAAGPGGRKVLLASLVIGLASLVVIAAVSLTRGPTSAHPSGGASALAGPELGAGAPRSASRPPDEPVPAPSTRPPEGQAAPSGNDATLGSAAVAPDAASSTARTTKTKPPGSPAPPSASEKPKPAASVPSVAASPQPPPPPNCTPPYKLDGNGKHVPKPECL